MARTTQFRRVRHSAPVPFRVLAEDLPRSPWIDRLSALQFSLVVALACTTVVSAVFAIGHPLARKQIAHTLQVMAVDARTYIEAIAEQGLDSEIVQSIRPNATSGSIKSKTARATDCHPNYGGCVPIASDVDCRGGKGNGPAYSGRVAVIGYDVYGLDGDGDGIGCE